MPVIHITNVYHWHQPTWPSREPPSHTMTMAEAAAFGLQGGPTVTHHTIPAGDESDSDGLSSPVYDPFRIEEREDVSSGHELDSVVTGLGPGYGVLPDVEPLTPSMPLLEPKVMATPVTFIAEPLSQAEPTGVCDVAVGEDEPQPWYSLPVGVSLQQVLTMVQRNVGVPVREILPTSVDSISRTGTPTFL